jgi:starch-binding outer membrane protein, SusD/RagB family
MKKIKIFVAVIILTTVISCKKSFLDEVPLDFLSTTNAFKNTADFQASINNLYRLVRDEFYTQNDSAPMDFNYRTDEFIDVTAATPNLEAQIQPNSGTMSGHWTRIYKIVSEANTVISRIPTSDLSAAEKLLFEARGRFFRALAYRSLAYLFGGVPLQLEEVTAPKVDFNRATKKEVLTQCIADLQFAVANLPALNASATALKDGEVSSQAANHLLAEVYLADGQFQKAVDAATAVITSPGVALMTARFGTRKTEVPGDVYSDLFRTDNQNRRSAGNTEAILVIQIQADVPGGAAASNLGFANAGGYCMERVHAPLVRDLVINNVAPFLWPAGDYTGGRGVGFMAPSNWFTNTIYQPDFATDIRNANHNFVRKFKSNNPASPFYNTEIDFAALPPGSKGTGGVTLTSGVASRAFYPYQAKATTPYQHPTPLYAAQSGSGARPWPFSLKDGGGFTFRDEYMMRLAETYLLRAEAYLGLSNTTLAAQDINVVRVRANATPVAPASVDIDYILDERMRELGIEEKRLLTLMRLGKWYDRIIKCNPYYAPQANTKFNLWPIPQQEIERNREVKMQQNPGYPG